MKRHGHALLFVLPFRRQITHQPSLARRRNHVVMAGERIEGNDGGDERTDSGGGGMKILGICGGIGSGKSTACRLMVDSLGCAARIDADMLAHAVYEPGSKASEEIVSEFGGDVVLHSSDDSVHIDRKKLGAIVFSDPASMSKLERIVWPHVRGKIEERIGEIEREYRRPDADATNNIIVVEAALLLETDWHDLFDGLWVIRSSASAATRRITETRGLTEGEALIRIRAQDRRRGIGRSGRDDDDDDGGNNDELRDEIKNGVVTAVIRNDGSMGDLEESLRKALFDPSSFKRGA
ncbi:hypothetical protein ACHAXA_009052 [Cyclostephanos tholiformis]|uniref:Dephospho-CoA kinase n=1 Tax=Cyclostephanos tholiformis TaxID=382380 RepID=A0ABD3R8T6_9STRA